MACDADLIEDFEAGPASVERGYMWRPVQKTIGIFARINRAGFELERTAMG